MILCAVVIYVERYRVIFCNKILHIRGIVSKHISAIPVIRRADVVSDRLASFANERGIVVYADFRLNFGFTVSDILDELSEHALYALAVLNFAGGVHIRFLDLEVDSNLIVVIISFGKRCDRGILSDRVRGERKSAYAIGYRRAVFFDRKGYAFRAERGFDRVEFFGKVFGVAHFDALGVDNAAKVIEVKREILFEFVAVVNNAILIGKSRGNVVVLDCRLGKGERRPRCGLNGYEIGIPFRAGGELMNVRCAVGVYVNRNGVVNRNEFFCDCGIERVSRPFVAGNNVRLYGFAARSDTRGFACSSFDNGTAGAGDIFDHLRFEVERSGHHIAFFDRYCDSESNIAIVVFGKRCRNGIIAVRRGRKGIRRRINAGSNRIAAAVSYAEAGNRRAVELVDNSRKFFGKIERAAEYYGFVLHNAANVVEVKREIFVAKSVLFGFSVTDHSALSRSVVILDCGFGYRNGSPFSRADNYGVFSPFRARAYLMKVLRTRNVHVKRNPVVKFDESGGKFGVDRVRRPLVRGSHVDFNRFGSFADSFRFARYSLDYVRLARKIGDKFGFEIAAYGRYKRFAYRNGYRFGSVVAFLIGCGNGDGIVTHFVGRKAVVRNGYVAAVLVFYLHFHVCRTRVVAYGEVGNVPLARFALFNRSERDYGIGFIFYFKRCSFGDVFAVAAVRVVRDRIIGHKPYDKFVVGKRNGFVAVFNGNRRRVIVASVERERRRHAIFAAYFYRNARSHVHCDRAVVFGGVFAPRKRRCRHYGREKSYDRTFESLSFFHSTFPPNKFFSYARSTRILSMYITLSAPGNSPQQKNSSFMSLSTEVSVA